MCLYSQGKEPMKRKQLRILERESADNWVSAHLCNKHLSGTCVPGTLLISGDTKVNGTQSLDSRVSQEEEGHINM